MWDETSDHPMHLREELEQMLRAVAMTATGWTRCVHCTHLLVQSAREKFVAPDGMARSDQEEKKWEQAGTALCHRGGRHRVQFSIENGILVPLTAHFSRCAG